MIRNRLLLRSVSIFLIFQFLTQLFLPTVSFALTSGPSQPEFSSFEPVATTNMVDLFTGDFTYNLPVLEVPGPQGSSYPLSLSYHSGVAPEEEASWVGYGWTLNPGAINRSTRGVPDDFNGKKIIFRNQMPRNWTATAGAGLGFEIGSTDTRLGLNASIRYNNYRGFGYNAGAGLYIGRGVVSLGYNVDNGTGSFSLNVDPSAILNNTLEKHEEQISYKATRLTKAKNDGDKTEKIDKQLRFKGGNVNLLGSSYGMFTYAETSKPTTVQKFTGKSYNVSVGSRLNPAFWPVGATGNLSGSFSYQDNEASEDVNAFGYYYSANATSDGIMDYHLEKDTEFNKRDVFLGIPFNDADNFIVTGEGIGGGFRLYNKSAGHFGPRNVTSSSSILNVGGEIDAGTTFGFGLDLGKGKHSINVQNWNKDLSLFKAPVDAANPTDEPLFFRFNNDLGGEWGTNHSDKPIQAAITSGKQLSLNNNNFKFNNGERSGRSSYIGSNTNGQMLTGSVPSFAAYNKNQFLNTQSGRSTADADLIGELAVFNESGSRYLYGLPVYNKEEKNLSYSVEGAAPANIVNNYLIYETKNTKVTVGQEQNNAYASTYLLTEITTPDYFDNGPSGIPNGPDPSDFGGYTRFNYQKLSDWYNWRAPYSGLLYNRNSQSDSKDDMGTYSEGQKEIYYLNAIETKTHVAIFETEDRLDSKEASSTNPLAQYSVPGSTNLKRLKKIKLYSLEDCKLINGTVDRDPVTGSPKPKSGAIAIKTVYFEYDYSLSSNVPNSTSNQGKLKLKKVYFEYNGVTKTRISPYEFVYAYPDYSMYPAKYTNAGNENVSQDYAALSPTMQNPAHLPTNSDAWGNYQPNGQTRFADMRGWLDQTKRPNIDFDPAPWHLKVIKLPSGGEIHIQYEQDDYSYVQDQEAHVMANIKAISSDGGFQRKYYLNVTSMGVLESDVTSMNWIRDAIKKRYLAGGEKMYFKILYTLLGNSTPTLSSCNAEFITGYASISQCEIDGGGLYVILNDSNRLPDQVCQDFVKTQRLGMIDPFGNCNPQSALNENEAVKVVKQLAGFIGGISVPGIMCMERNLNYSYLRIPTPLAKKGGGTRVKRLMMHTYGLDGAPADREKLLYGSEFLYAIKEGTRLISSGVATNEPQTIREENILVKFVARKGQNLWSKIVAGKDKKQSEGPLGESILPAPGVGYSRVVTRNIHSGKTNPGFSISEFYTAKDYPVILAHPDKPGTMTAFNRPSPDVRFLIGILVNIIMDKTWATQGFSFVINNMHGQVKSAATYSGPYADVNELTKSTLISKTSHEYFKPGEKIPVRSSTFGEVIMKNPGREVDLTFAQKKVTETSYDANIEGDVEMTIIPAFIPIPVFYPTAMPSLNFTEGALYTHATTKVVRYPAIMKKTTVYQDGILHNEENLVFDELTGKPVAVKSSDEFKGAYLAQTVPAGWEYPNYTTKAKTEGKVIQTEGSQTVSFSVSNDYLKFGGNAGCQVLAQITTGDILDLGGNAYYQVSSIDFSQDRVQLVKANESVSAIPSSITRVKIVRSGRNNELTGKAGEVTYHNVAEASVNAAALSIPANQRWVTAGTDRNDGSKFISDLNAAFAGTGPLPLPGPYYHMNVAQYAEHLPEDCSPDLTDATIKNVNIIFMTQNGSKIIKMASFEIDCGGSVFKTVKMPEGN